MNINTKILLATCSLLLLTACEKDVSDNANLGSEGTSAAHLSLQEEFVKKAGDRVFFALDKSNISDESKHVLQKQAEFMKEHSELDFVIEGHTDERGTREYNMALGERRANSVKHYLQQQGVNPSKLTTVSFGKEKYAVEGSNEEAWAQNRRAVTLVR